MRNMLASHVLIKTLKVPEHLAALFAAAELYEIKVSVLAIGKRLLVVAKDLPQ